MHPVIEATNLLLLNSTGGAGGAGPLLFGVGIGVACAVAALGLWGLRSWARPVGLLLVLLQAGDWLLLLGVGLPPVLKLAFLAGLGVELGILAPPWARVAGPAFARRGLGLESALRSPEGDVDALVDIRDTVASSPQLSDKVREDFTSRLDG